VDPLRHRLIVEATRLFVERGFDGTSMREIADACGVTKAALYYHYPSKSDLLLDIVATYLDTMAAVVDRARASEPTAARQLEAIVAELFALPPEGRAVIRLAMHDLRHLPEADQAAFGVAYQERFLQPLADLVQAGSASGEFAPHDPTTVVWIILGMLYPFLSRRPAPDGEEKAMADLLDVLLTGLKTRATTGTS
jgi:AcrR family transcriptional regulator